jgi:hypothetical protein
MRAADIPQAAPAGRGPIRVNVSPATSIRVAPIRVAPIRVRLSRPGRLSATSAESN